MRIPGKEKPEHDNWDKATSAQSRIATARVQPADPAFTFTGKQATVKPVVGN